MTSTCRTIVVTAAALALLGCAEERPTRPAAMQIDAALPAWDASIDPVLQSGPTIPFLAVNESTFVCTLSTNNFDPTNVDLRIAYNLKSHYAAANSFIQDWDGGALVPIQRRHPDVFYPFPEILRNYALISTARLRLEQVLSPESGEIKVVSHDISGDVTAQLLAFDPGYQTLSLPLNVFASGIAAHDDELWVFQRAWNAAGDFMDSICVYSQSGQRIRTVSCPFVVWSMEWSSKGLWIMHNSQPITFTLCDSTLTVIGGFSLSDFRDRFLAGIMIRNDEFWLYDRYKSQLFRIDADASLVSGQAIVLDSIVLQDPPGYSGISAVSDNRFIYINTTAGGHLASRAYNGLGHLVYELPGLPSERDMTWDGEAVWTLHYGLASAFSNSLTLSRFSLR